MSDRIDIRPSVIRHAMRNGVIRHAVRPGVVRHAIGAPAPPVVGAPENTVAPAISEILFGGEAITGGAGTWVGTAPITYAYQYQYIEVGGSWTDLAGADAADVTPTYAQMRARAFRLKVTATNDVGSTIAYSNEVESVIYSLIDTYSPDILHDYVETSGSTIEDVAGAVDGETIGGPSLAQPALITGFPYSIYTNTVGRIDSDPGWDWASEDWTCAFAFNTTETGVRGLWLCYDTTSGQRFGLYSINGALRLQSLNGSAVNVDITGTYNDGVTHAVAMRYVAATDAMHVWIDGAIAASGTGNLGATPTTPSMRWGGWGHAGAASIHGQYQMILGVKRALADAECVTLSTVS